MRVDTALRALAEPRRREILRLVWDRERAVGEIAASVGVSQPAVSQHLQVLREAHLVSDRRDGARRLYRARPDTVQALREFLDDYWTSGLSQLRDAAEAAEQSKRSKRRREH